jgi:signal transduction histidine kinase
MMTNRAGDFFKRFDWNSITLKKRLLLGYALFISLSLLVLTLIIDRVSEGLFSRMVGETIEARKADIIETMTGLYQPLRAGFDEQNVERIGMLFVHEGYILTLEDSRGNLIWDAHTHDMEKCHQIISEITARMGKYPRLQGDFGYTRVPIMFHEQTEGFLTIETYGPIFFSQGESFFLRSLTRLFFAALMVFTVSSIVISVLLASAVLGAVDKKQRRLTADLAHELRTPLTALRGTFEALLDGVWEPTPERLASGFEEVGRLTALVEDLSLLTDIEWEYVKLRKTGFDLADLLNATAARFKAEALQKGLTLELEVRSQIIHADYDRLGQVFVNILSNAIKYTDSGSIIIRNVGKDVSIADTGIGIPSDALPHLFERFYRSDRSRARAPGGASGGAGIGLTIAAALVNAHGGAIRAESVPGRGSVCRVRL